MSPEEYDLIPWTLSKGRTAREILGAGGADRPHETGAERWVACLDCDGTGLAPYGQALRALEEARRDRDGWRDDARRLEAERDALRYLLAVDTPWPVWDVLRRLADAADHLLVDHACDRHGYEEVGAARDSARVILERMALTPPAEPSSPPPPAPSRG